MSVVLVLVQNLYAQVARWTIATHPQAVVSEQLHVLERYSGMLTQGHLSLTGSVNHAARPTQFLGTGHVLHASSKEGGCYAVHGWDLPSAHGQHIPGLAARWLKQKLFVEQLIRILA